MHALHTRVSFQVHPLRGAHVNEYLRVLLHARNQLRQRAARLFHHSQHLQRANQTITSGGAVQTEQMAGGLATENATLFAQHPQHIPVADVGATERNTEVLQGLFQTEVTHERTNHRAAERAFVLPRTREHIKQLVAVHQTTEMVHHDKPIAVTVQRNTHVRTSTGHRELKQVRVRGPTAGVDVAAVG